MRLSFFSSTFVNFFYPKVRICCGIISIGFNLLLPWFIYYCILHGIIHLPWGSLGTVLGIIFFYFCLISLANGVLDFLSGFFLEKKAGRYLGSFCQWIQQWLIGSSIFIILQTCGGLILMMIIRGAYLNFAACTILLILAATLVHYCHFLFIPSLLKKPYLFSRDYLAQLTQELILLGLKNMIDEKVFYFYESEDGYTINGGSIGLGAQRRYMISSVSVESLSPRELGVLIWRDEKIIGSQEKLRQFYYSLAYCVFGLILACCLVSHMTSPLFWERWFWCVSFLSSWFFLSLFLLPSYSRRRHLIADRQVIALGITKKEYIALLKKIQFLNKSEQETSSWIEYIFYPIPTLYSRLEQLQCL